MSEAIQQLASDADRMRVALSMLAWPIPSTEGMNPKDRADRLHAELERRIRIAKTGLRETANAE